jgi:hypothetical protein
MLTLAKVLSESRVTGEDPRLAGGHIDRARHLVLSPKMFFKRIRPSGSGFEYHDLTCELFSARLADRLGLPVPICIPIMLSGLGLGLVSAFVGEKTIAGILTEVISNSDKLAAMFVFEQLLLNVDDKIDHFRARDIPGEKYEFYLVDHGHTLHAWRADLQDPSTIDILPSIHLPSSSINEYRIHNYAQLQSHVRDLASRAIEVTDYVLGEVFRELGQVETEDAGLQTFLDQEARHKTIITKIIQVRAKYLDQIIRLKCQQCNIRTEPEQAAIPMIGVS